MQVIYGNDIDTIASQLEQRKKNWPNYTLKALLFACAMLFSAYMNLSSSTSVAIKILFVVDIVVFFIIDGILYINLPRWGNALVCISCLLLQVALCLLTIPFNGCYAFAILVVVFLILVVALLQPKFQHSVKKYVLPSFTTSDGDTQEDISDQENHYLNHLFDISNGIATCGGLVTGIMGYYSYLVGPVTAAGFFFFCTILLGLFLMMVIAMRAVSPPHATCLAIVLKVLLLLTIITDSISFVHHSVTNPKVVK
jgi:hypothetical protein